MLGSMLARTSPACTAAALTATLWRPWGAGVDVWAAAVQCRQLATAAADASANGGGAWRQRFDGVAPGSVLQLGFLNSAADIDIKIGEHEAIELTSSQQLQAQQQPHPHRDGACVGACCLMCCVCHS